WQAEHILHGALHAAAQEKPPGGYSLTSLSPLHAIVDVALAQRAGWQPADLARAFMDGGARCVQIRAKDLASDRFLELCDRLVGVADPYGAVVIVNDRPDLAVMANAPGGSPGPDRLRTQ